MKRIIESLARLLGAAACPRCGAAVPTDSPPPWICPNCGTAV